MNQIAMSSPDLTEREARAVYDTVRSTHLAIGPQIVEFERSSAEYVNGKHAVGVNSGTSGLHLAVIAAGVTDNDLVITTPFSFVASANAVLYERGIPVFVDVDGTTGNIDPGQVAAAAEALTREPGSSRGWLPRSHRADGAVVGSLKAILPVHTFGQPSEMDPLCAVSAQHDVAIVEDACESIGAEYKGRRVGALGDVGIFAYYPNKQMTTGEGGMLVTNRDDWRDLFRSLRNQGRDVFDSWLNHSRLGFNYRLDEMSAALGVVQLSRLDELLEKRARVAAWYSTRLQSMQELVEPPTIAPSTTRMSWFVYVARLARGIDRDGLMRSLSEMGIPSRPYFTPIHLQPFYRQRFGFQEGDFPIAEDLGRRSLALPFSSVMTEDQVDHVCRQLLNLLKQQHASI